MLPNLRRFHRSVHSADWQCCTEVCAFTPQVGHHRRLSPFGPKCAFRRVRLLTRRRRSKLNRYAVLTCLGLRESECALESQTSFLETIVRRVSVSGYGDMGITDRLAEAPGQPMSTLMKPVDIVNWLSGGRWLSQFGEKVTREGAYIDAQRNGYSEERAQLAFDEITGNFGRRQPSAYVAALVRNAGFLNPAIQIMRGQVQRVTDPDPQANCTKMS